MKILGIETSCDETAAAVYDSSAKQVRSSVLFSQIKKHEQFGGVVPEIASRSHLEKIAPIVQRALDDAQVSVEDIDVVAVTTKPGLIGSLLVGVSFAKGLAWAHGKKLVGVDHLEGHIFSAFLQSDFSAQLDRLSFPYLCLSASGGHTALYYVRGFGDYEAVAQTRDDAAGEAFDKVAYMMGYSYPGGPALEKLAQEVGFEDFYSYPRGQHQKENMYFSFSGLKTAVLYDLVNKGVFDLKTGPKLEKLTHDIKTRVASSLHVCIADMFSSIVTRALKKYPEVAGVSFVGGVACNGYISQRLAQLCEQSSKQFVVSPKPFSTDNAAMIALVGAHKAQAEQFASWDLDVSPKLT